jgi:hypothetical protein
MRLYEISESYYRWRDKVIEMEGEVSEELFEELEQIQSSLDDKMEAYGVIIKSLRAETEALKNEKDILERRIKKNNNIEESLIFRLSDTMQQFGKDKFQTTKVQLSFRKSKSVQILDEKLLPENFIKITKTPIKLEIKKALLDGLIVEGAELIENYNLQIK